MQETQVQSLVGKIPWRRKWQPTPVLLPGNSHGQRSLTGYIPWGFKRVGHDLPTKQLESKEMRSTAHCILGTQSQRHGGEHREADTRGSRHRGRSSHPPPYLPAQVPEADVQLVLLTCLPLVAAAVFCSDGEQRCSTVGRKRKHRY